MAFSVCDVRPDELARAVLCLDELSKNVKGELLILDADGHDCRTFDCRTLVVSHAIRAEVSSHDCDSKIGARFDGRLTVRDLTTVFTDGSGLRRGLHTATFQWRTPMGIVTGRMSGMTNEGTHREPAFKGCQQCGDVGVLEGRLCGRLVRSREPRLTGAQVTAAYRFAFEPTEKGGEGTLVGTIEGLVVRSCEPPDECVDFTTAGNDTNPRVVGPVSIEVSGPNGPMPDTGVTTWAGITGLDLYYSSTLSFAQPVSRVELTLMHMSNPPTATAYDAAGNSVAMESVTAGQQIPQPITLNGPGIVTVVVDSPTGEVLLTRLCWAT